MLILVNDQNYTKLFAILSAVVLKAWFAGIFVPD